ncbi:MAG: ROK family protein [Cohnella sp.]|nr:ROK family protein [Cohnella sp.]
MDSLWLNSESDYAVGVDIGGTKINAGIVSKAGEVLHSVSLPTLAGQEATSRRAIEAVERLLAERASADPKPRVRGIGVGTAGQVDWNNGQIRFANGLLPGYGGTPMRSLLESRFGMPVRVDNDVNVLAYTERLLGAGKSCKHFICLAIGTGVGGAIMVDGRLVHGAWGGAGELGHLSVDFNGSSCICGGRGCLEQYASGTSIARRMREGLAESGMPAEGVDTRETFARWQAGDRLATKVMEETIAALGAAIASLAHTFNPEAIVIGGGVAEAGDLLFKELDKEVRSRAMASLWEGVRLEPAYRGNWSGMIGAALQLWNET